MTVSSHIGVVIIGRNEGKRLFRCLTSTLEETKAVTYVDSGSNDGSQKMALQLGSDLVELDRQTPFTAAKARNAGLKHFLQKTRSPKYVQFIDGDCELQPDWLHVAHDFLETHPSVAVVCGRRRERFPEASIYNYLIDQEWDTPIGCTMSCGGDALMRVSALIEVGSFNSDLIAGEEPELCFRLRSKSWKIWRLDTEMTLHDAELKKFSQWWKRSKRAGFAYAEGAAMHGVSSEKYNIRQTISAFLWGVLLPCVAVLGSMISFWFLLLLMAWPLQVVRLGLRDNSWPQAFFLTLGKLPEAQGVLSYGWGRCRGTKSKLIEYK